MVQNRIPQILLLLLLNSCAMFVSGSTKKFVKPPEAKANKETLLIAFHEVNYFEGRVHSEQEITEQSDDPRIKRKAEEFKNGFEKNSGKKVKLVSLKNLDPKPMLIIRSRKTIKSTGEKALTYLWGGLSAVTLTIIPFWVKTDLDLEVTSNMSGPEKHFNVKRSYKQVLSIFLLPVSFFKHPKIVMPALEKDVVNEILAKAF